MEQEKKDRLRRWFESLDQSKQIDIALECIKNLWIQKPFVFGKIQKFLIGMLQEIGLTEANLKKKIK